MAIKEASGRRSLPAKDRLSEAITMVVTKATKRALEREAEDAGYRSLGAYIREVKMGL